jgi:hypothetical protein
LLASALAAAVALPVAAQTAEPDPTVAPTWALERLTTDALGRELGDGRLREVELATDGTVWLAQGSRVLALDQPGSIAPRRNGWRWVPTKVRVAPDGTVWATEEGGSVVSAEDGVWVDRSDAWPHAGASLALLPDGSAWRVVWDAERGNALALLGEAGWQLVDAPALDALLGRRAARFTFAQTTDGLTWLGVDGGDRPSGLAVLADGGWTPVGTLGSVVAPRVLDLAAGADGSLWVLADLDAPTREPDAGGYVLLRRGADGDWTVFGASEGMPQDRSRLSLGWSRHVPAPLAVDQAGRVWFSIEQVGLHVFDGSAFERVVAPGLRSGALDIAMGPEGDGWIVGATGGLFRLPASPAD